MKNAKNSQPGTPSTSSVVLQAHLDVLLHYLNTGTPFAYDAGVGPQIIERMRANYARKYALYQMLLQAQEEGIHEVTVRSATQTVTMIVRPTGAGNSAADGMIAQLGEELGQLNRNILHQLKDQELTIAQKGTYDGSPEDRRIHALCMPPAAPIDPQPELISGERCPFLPASTVPTTARRPTTEVH